MKMDTVVTLTQVDQDRKIFVGALGFGNQTVFATVNDALTHLFITNPLNSTITIKKTSDDFAWITIEQPDETVYYELCIVKPLHYET